MKRLYTICSVLFLLNFSGAQNTLEEGFESWPPEGWEFYLLGDALDGWRDDFNGNANTGTGSAYSSINNSQCDNWMVTSEVNVVNDAYELRFWEIHNTIEFYDKGSVLVSSGSGNPEDGDFVEVFESNILNTVAWEERTVDLSAYSGETIYVAFRYEGTFHAWNVDDVTIAPANFTDGSLTQFSSPVGVIESPQVLPVMVVLENVGQTVINQVEIEWEVNGVPQTTFLENTLFVLPGQSESIVLGNFDFATEDAYDITATLSTPGDFDSSNDETVTTFEITAFRDGGITAITPQGTVPVQGGIDVKTTVTNFGANIIDVTDIDWSVNEVAQVPFSTSNLNLQPGETRIITIGNFNFAEGLNEISVTLNAFGDVNAGNDAFTTSVAINTFYESFEGPNFPPEGWSMNFGVLDNANFGNPVEGDNFYTSNVDDNFFGRVSDTLFTPPLEIKVGDTFSFYIKTSQFQPADHKLIFRNATTGDVTVITDIQNSPGINNWALRLYDISAAAGVSQIGITSEPLNGGGQTNFDVITSTARLHQFNNDMRMLTGDIPFVALQNVNRTYECDIRNAGAMPILGSDYTIKLMEAPGIELASVQGVDLQSWEAAKIEIDYAFTDLGQKRLYFEIAYAQDENPTDNRVLDGLLSVVPNTAIVNAIGAPDGPGFIPFTPNGSTQTLGEDDLSETLYYNEEINNPGLAYGVVYKYNNLLPTRKISEYPLQVWIAQKNLDNLGGGWQDPEEMVLVFDGVLEFLPGNNRDIYIPFDQPIMINGIEDVVVKHYQYDPPWPPAIFRFLTTNVTDGPVRAIVAFEVFDLDPISPPDFFGESSSYPFIGFVVDPSASNTVLTGTVTDAANNTPIANATVSILGSSITGQTDTNGNYTLPSLPDGSYQLTTSATGYFDEEVTVVFDMANQVQDFSLNALADISISGTVFGSNDIAAALNQVQVVLSQNEVVIETTSSDANGNFEFLSVFGGSDYKVTASLYGYNDENIIVVAPDANVDLGDVILDEEFIPPFDVVVDNPGETTINWKSPKLSEKVKLQRDFGVNSASYTNEPFEEVWLGNIFEITETTTLTSVEIFTDVFELNVDFVTIDIFDLASNTVIASSEPFLIVEDSLQTVDIPNIVVNESIAAMVHWQDNADSTNALVVDTTVPDANNVAVIRFPNQSIDPLTTVVGDNFNYAFHVRVNTLDDGTPITNGENVMYNVYRGLASEFPDTTNWTQLNGAPVTELSLIDSDNVGVEADELYRYSVETIYSEGTSEVTFSGEIFGQDILSITGFELLQSKIVLFPNPVQDDVNLEISPEVFLDGPIEIYNIIGSKVLNIETNGPANGYITTDVSSLAGGTYFMRLMVNGVGITKKFIKQ